MKVRINITLDVDPQSWAESYGTTDKPADIREDVRGYFQTLCREQLIRIGCEAPTTNPHDQ